MEAHLYSPKWVEIEVGVHTHTDLGIHERPAAVSHYMHGTTNYKRFAVLVTYLLLLCSIMPLSCNIGII